MSKLFSLKRNGISYKEVTATSSRDPALLATLKKDSTLFSAKISCDEIGMYFVANNLPRLIRYSKLVHNTKDEIRSLKQTMVTCLMSGDFSNDNMTFFMLERGLVTESRNELTIKGNEIVRLLSAIDCL
ncbi:hypothetical protein [Vibrio sp. Hal054]|uniref:hypothetical protein n=1 Tax=Vibrio sp. Hal054 TaxID=3035158 RepID=UPI00301C1332